MAIGRSVFNNISMLMAGKASPKDIARVLDRLAIEPSGNLDTLPLDSVNVAAAQVLCKKYVGLGDYIADMNAYVADAANRRAHIVCFPALAGLLPLSFLPHFSSMLPQLQITGGDIPDPERVRECLSHLSEIMFDAYFNTMSALAARHGVYIMAGSAVYLDEGEMRHRAFLFDHTGEIAGTQDKIVLSRLERALGITPGTDVKAFSTPMGCFSMIIESDILYFETARAAKSQGAQVILHPALFPGSYTPMDSAGGLSLRVQENSIYGVQCTMIGDTGLGVNLEAPCAVYAPNELLRARVKNGLMAQSSGKNEPDVLCATLDLEVIANIRNPYLHDRNPDLLGRYIDKLY